MVSNAALVSSSNNNLHINNTTFYYLYNEVVFILKCVNINTYK